MAEAIDPVQLRRQFRLPAEDEAFLDGLALRWEAIIEGGQRWIIIYAVPLPAGYEHQQVDVAILMAPGYPPGPLDMAYFLPALKRTDRRAIPCSDVLQDLDKKKWQRWSRHRIDTVNKWIEGEDSFGSHFLYMQAWLVDELKR